ncbi:MAG: hypothetical protein EOP04_09620 [Proteobacteria bacterium]|nr:MAG: hypothetical protein EOP04_09620 [Pseudomonadota bacterium]
MQEVPNRSKLILIMIAAISILSLFDLFLLFKDYSGFFTTREYTQAFCKFLIVIIGASILIKRDESRFNAVMITILLLNVIAIVVKRLPF